MINILLFLLWIVAFLSCLKFNMSNSPILKGYFFGIAYFILLPILPVILFTKSKATIYSYVWNEIDINKDAYNLFGLLCIILIFRLSVFIVSNISTVKTKNSLVHIGVNIEIDKRKYWRIYILTAIPAIIILCSLKFILIFNGVKWSDSGVFLPMLLGSSLYSTILMLTLSFVVISTISVLCIIKSDGHKFFNIGMYFLVPIIHMYVSANRIYLFVFTIIFFIEVVRKLNYKVIVTYLVILIFGIYFFTLWSSIRAFLHENTFVDSVQMALEYEENLSENVSGFDGRINKQIIDITEGSNVYVLNKVIEDFPDKYNYITVSPYVKVISVFIPRTIWPNKPESTPLILAKLYNPEFEGFSLNGSIFSEGYVSLGYIGVLLISLFIITVIGAFKRSVESFISKEYAIYVSFFFALLCVRFGSLSDVVLMILFNFTVIFLLGLLFKSKL